MQIVKQNQIISISLAILVFLSGCNTLQTKEQTGTAAGATVGAVVGALFSDNKLVGAAIGAALGGIIGNRWGAYLDEKDQQSVATTTEQAINTGETQEWSNPENGTSGTTEVVATEQVQQSVEIPVLKDRVETIPPLDIIGETYRATKTSNVRGGPGTDYEIVESLPSGKNINVVGKVQGKNWYMISQNGIGSGFVHSSLLVAAPSEIVAEEQPVPDAAIEKQTATAAKTCRTIQQTVTLKDGSEQQEEIKACQGPNGWEVV